MFVCCETLFIGSKDERSREAGKEGRGRRACPEVQPKQSRHRFLHHAAARHFNLTDGLAMSCCLVTCSGQKGEDPLYLGTLRNFPSIHSGPS